MTILIALTVSVILQFVAAILAISLIRRTRYNISWLLITAAFLMMAVRRLLELIEVWPVEDRQPESLFSSWTAVVISVLMLLGVIYIRRIFNLQKRIDELTRENENRVLNAIIRTQESERKKFAKELHDGIGPLLASIKMSVSALVDKRTEASHRKILQNVDHLIDESVLSLKEIANKLSPHVLVNFGLLRALRAFVDRLENPGSPAIKLNSNLKDIRFDPNIEVVVYRIICELITNTLQHAGATEVNIDLYHEKDLLTLEYFDNGKGFQPEEVLGNPSGMGYANIQSRIRSLDGSIKVISNPHNGVNISIVIKASKYA